jgi:hypothetical protein
LYIFLVSSFVSPIFFPILLLTVSVSKGVYRPLSPYSILTSPLRSHQ